MSATLAGLLFVGITISLEHVLSGASYMNRAFIALFLQFEMLVIALFGVVPGQPVWVTGAEFMLTGLAVLAGTSVFAINFPDERNAVLGSAGPRYIRRGLAWLACLAPVASGAGLIAHLPWALYFLVPAEIASLYLSIGNAWVLSVELPRRMREGPR